MIVCKCDKCGKETHKLNHYTIVEEKYVPGFTIPKYVKLCNDCYNSVCNVVNNAIKKWWKSE